MTGSTGYKKSVRKETGPLSARLPTSSAITEIRVADEATWNPTAMFSISSGVFANPALNAQLDNFLYSLDAEERDFFQQLTGIQDEDALREHILAVQAKAYEVYSYPCIRRFSFIRLKIARLPGYKHALKLLQGHKDPILLDIGCCFGNDARKAVIDGWPVHNVVASDLQQGFWECGHELFKSTPETFPATFIPGDIFDPAVFTETPQPSSSPPLVLPPLNTLTSLTPLTHRISAIHASALFHLFPEARQLELARRLAALLRPEKGSIIFGQHASKQEKGVLVVSGQIVNGQPVRVFCHSPESWREMWTREVFGPDSGMGVKVKVEAELVEHNIPDMADGTAALEHDGLWFMNWAVRVV
ncbi:hypothetical protein GALMADRAFT_245992 [Galerina marginata CBS 339.88]|uniref:Methyltransferase domain-containing protein n=1 Tax=Galerina marginata (strain CBS 339.88) TaxID=685588 RepID=A0A067T179_GALM3|nr:hypothetical protein GALMADRAFT_245992 [Galerina marginata CBS 339.88]